MSMLSRQPFPLNLPVAGQASGLSCFWCTQMLNRRDARPTAGSGRVVRAGELLRLHPVTEPASTFTTAAI